MKKILIVDFGDSKPHKIKNIIDDFADAVISDNLAAYSTASEIKPDGIILGGGIRDIKAPDAPKIDPRIFSLNIPVLGICSGMETIALAFGAEVGRDRYKFEKGPVKTFVNQNSDLFRYLPIEQTTHMFHGYSVETLPEGFTASAYTDGGPIAAFENPDLKIHGTIFHPEGKYSEYGKSILHNFIKIL